ncbi:efflux RND transporter permease subunit [Haliangium ochraceum]|uniref:Acriflavin resistance protein n=1 Tax=Haliangium ochraceum (strain DSM 14365 / JCM 11303 / SMP-2) TaxID=502025 RepID=D0LX25_HALO1|nr:efflux RND transporter permease subunit [Haliangium ochraceum]ACY16067.1 acriflavin resistance protein [Haliangium ochraceum DSM 14365]
MSAQPADAAPLGPWQRAIGFFVASKPVVALLLAMLIGVGLLVSPMAWDLGDWPRDPVPVDAIPDIGENQQIVFTEWAGRSPRDIEDQVTYPLTTALLGIPGVRTVRSFSMFGFSSIYVIFEEDVEFYWSRSRVLEKLAALPAGTLPSGVTPTLGPDATALGQVYWYTLQGRDPRTGEIAGGWDLHELRSIQDFTVRYALQSVPGVSEVASIGGHVQEYQVDVDPEALRGHGVRLDQVVAAVKNANLDVGARTLEVNRVEYVVRGVGFIDSLADLERAVVRAEGDVPLHVGDVARVTLGPAGRRGALDIGGAEAVGGVVVVRYGENPLAVIERIRAKIAEIAPGLPQRSVDDGEGGERRSQVTIVPFYDRTTLIHETLDTLSTALVQQILITVLVVLVMLRRLRSALAVSAVLPLAVLGTFAAMKWSGVDANVMSLAGVAIAIGSMVDIGIVLVENIVSRLDEAGPDDDRLTLIRDGAAEVAPAVLTSVATTVVSFLPVFALSAAEGKLFGPLAFAKSYALGAALLVAVVVLPALVHLLTGRRRRRRSGRGEAGREQASASAVLGRPDIFRTVALCLAGVAALWYLAGDWMPLGMSRGTVANLVFVALLVAVLLGVFALFQRVYARILAWCLEHKAVFLALPTLLVSCGATSWLGAETTLDWMPEQVRETRPMQAVAESFPGLGREFMPPFDEGAFLYMPTTMPHASLGQALEMLQTMDAAIAAIPEVENAVGKLGRVDSPLDPAPVSMFETVVTYKPEYVVNEDGERVRQWRDHIRSPDDIWQEIVHAAEAPGLTSAPQLMPIATRIVMLQSGMRAPLGLKLRGPDLETLERVGLAFEEALAEVPSIRAETVFADRIVGKPYIELELDRAALARYGLSITAAQEVIQVALGGRVLTSTVQGRERYPVRVRYMREERDSVDSLGRVLVDTPDGKAIPLGQLAELRYERGPQVIKSEDTFLTSYVLFDRVSEVSEVAVVEEARAHLEARLADGSLELPAGVSYVFAGSYENQVRSEQRLTLLVPLALGLVMLILYLQFRRASTTFIIYSAVIVAVSGGFLLLWLYGQPWFLRGELLGIDARSLFQVDTVHLSVAVWVGFIALVGIATDDGVVMATYLDQRFRDAEPAASIAAVRARTIEAGLRRVRPCLMTTATTILALLPVITATGRGADVMRPMALPVLGGMAIELITLFVVPVLYCLGEELRLRRRQ